ncbi:MAG: class I SAM-dependent methyltransferase [Candidatus Riflebacteria bacterium]|nr:class I SAM-dependent methyltransferase [Candidatus Riflebacteria bacterium]
MTTETRDVVGCLVCGAGPVAALPRYARFRRVTSDCRPWYKDGKIAICGACGLVQAVIDRGFEDEARRIYDAYEVYHQSGGQEQRTFSSADGISSPRSERLLRGVQQALGLPERGRLLDVGCGNGNLLRSFGRLHPGWTLAGFEYDQRHRATIEGLPGVTRFHSGDLAAIDGSFDLVTLLHALEHFPDPVGQLRSIRSRLAPGGRILVQVPDHAHNPFDLVIADHCVHFSPATLATVMGRAGVGVTFQSRDLIPREITLVGQVRPDGQEGTVAPPDGPAAGTVTAALDWLAEILGQARALAARGPLGIFGTSIAGAWLGGELEASVAFFVDEDPDRVGRRFLGREILAPAAIPADARVLVPFPGPTAGAIAARHGALAPRLVLPPAWPPAAGHPHIPQEEPPPCER